MIGRVLNTRQENTAVVEVERVLQHKLYKKRLRKRKKYLVHDKIGVKEGDKVSIVPTRPISKRKRFEIAEVLK